MVARLAGGERKGWVDLGGQWLGEEQVRIRALADELCLEIFEQHTDGLDVLRYDGDKYLDDNETTAPSALHRKATEGLLEALEETAHLVVPDAARPWASPLASEYDRMTIGQWLDNTSEDDYARFYVGNIVTFDQPGGAARRHEPGCRPLIQATSFNPS